MINIITSLSFVTIIVVLSFIFFHVIKDMFNKYLIIIKHKNYRELLFEFLEDAYDIIYKDQLLTYTSSAYKPNDDVMETIKRNFVKLSFELMGINVENVLIDFFGSKESLISNMLLFFQNKLDNDEILKMAQSMSEKKEPFEGYQ